MQTQEKELPSFTFALGDRAPWLSREGKVIPDVTPMPYSVETFDEFFEVFNNVRAPEKVRQYMVAQMVGDDRVRYGSTTVPRRCKGNVQPRRWIAFDLDCQKFGDKDKGIPEVPLSDEAFAEIIMVASRIGEGLYYETSSSKPGDRCARFVFSLDHALPRNSNQAVSNYIETLLPVAGWDKNVYRGEQPLYMPPVGVKVVRFDGDPINVSAIAPKVLELAPKPKQYVPKVRSNVDIKRSALVLDVIRELGLYIDNAGAGKHDICCPWADLHSDGRPSAAYYEPSASNGGVGGFKCLHAHCENRNFGDLMRFIEDCVGVRHAA